MGMNSRQARDAIYSMWKEAWEATDGWAVLDGVSVEPPVFYDNVAPDTPPDANKIKVEVMVQHSDTPMASFGSGRPNYDAVGFVVVKLFIPKDRGLTLADDMVNIVKRAFQGKRGTGVADSLVLRGVSTNEEGAKDRWFVIRTITPFEYEDEVV